MTRRVQQLTLLLFGGALVRLASGPELLRYVAPGSRSVVAVAGALIGLIGALPSIRATWCRPPARPARLAWAVLAPILAILVVGPPSLGAWTAARSRAAVPTGSSDFDPLPPGAVAALPVSQFVLRSMYDRGSTLQRRTVRLVGFVTSRHGHRFELTRLVITCCAADAERMTVLVVGGASARPDGTWVSVTGRYAGTVDHEPLLRASEVVATVQPEEPYE